MIDWRRPRYLTRPPRCRPLVVLGTPKLPRVLSTRANLVSNGMQFRESSVQFSLDRQLLRTLGLEEGA